DALQLGLAQSADAQHGRAAAGRRLQDMETKNDRIASVTAQDVAPLAHAPPACEKPGDHATDDQAEQGAQAASLEFIEEIRKDPVHASSAYRSGPSPSLLPRNEPGMVRPTYPGCRQTSFLAAFPSASCY